MIRIRVPVLICIAGILLLVSLGCSRGRQGDINELICELTGGYYHEDTESARWYCDPIPVTPSVPPQEAQSPIEAPTDASNGLNWPLEACDARPYLEVSSPDLGKQKNDCACAYHYQVTNRHPDLGIVLVPHLSRWTSESGAFDGWLDEYAVTLPAGESFIDTGAGWVFNGWGGFYSTCSMRDGDSDRPEYLYTDGIFARLDDPGCEWITGEERESLQLESLNLCQ